MKIDKKQQTITIPLEEYYEMYVKAMAYKVLKQYIDIPSMQKLEEKIRMATDKTNGMIS